MKDIFNLQGDTSKSLSYSVLYCNSSNCEQGLYLPELQKLTGLYFLFPLFDKYKLIIS